MQGEEKRGAANQEVGRWWAYLEEATSKRSSMNSVEVGGVYSSRSVKNPLFRATSRFDVVALGARTE
jgi:hypothetical protein